MKIVQLEQGSDIWREWRKSKITATSASIILGNNPWKSQVDLFNEMVGITPPQEQNAAMARGSAMEPDARKLFIEETGLMMEPICCESDEYPWMAASLDGFNQDNMAILEIKCPKERIHEMCCEGVIPQYYKDQIMHQLAVTKGKVAYYMSYRPEYPIQHAIIEVNPDAEYIGFLIEQERIFYENHLCMMLPPTIELFKPKR